MTKNPATTCEQKCGKTQSNIEKLTTENEYMCTVYRLDGVHLLLGVHIAIATRIHQMRSRTYTE